MGVYKRDGDRHVSYALREAEARPKDGEDIAGAEKRLVDALEGGLVRGLVRGNRGGDDRGCARSEGEVDGVALTAACAGDNLDRIDGIQRHRRLVVGQRVDDDVEGIGRPDKHRQHSAAQGHVAGALGITEVAAVEGDERLHGSVVGQDGRDRGGRMGGNRQHESRPEDGEEETRQPLLHHRHQSSPCFSDGRASRTTIDVLVLLHPLQKLLVRNLDTSRAPVSARAGAAS